MNVSLDCSHANLTESSRVDSSLTRKLQMETLSLTHWTRFDWFANNRNL